jgi:hypothetical protein
MRLGPNIAPLLALTVGLVACSTNSGKVDSAAPCDTSLPAANAGVDQSMLLGGPVQLDGTESLFCARYSDSAVYDWNFVSVPPGSAIDSTALTDNRTIDSVKTSFVPDVAGDYVVELRVSDESGESAPDHSVVSVAVGDAAPIADCGPDLTGDVDASLTFDGSASTDPEGAVLEYFWAMTGSPACSELSTENLYNAGGPNPTFVPDCEGIFTVSLVVSDGEFYSEPDICAVRVASENSFPIADAGDSEEFGVCADQPFQLNGWGSYDYDGDDLTYLWTVARLPAESAATDDNFDDPTSPEATFTWDVPGTYLLQLQVSDGVNWSAPDLVQFTVDLDATNDPPVANAGDDVLIEKEVDCESSSYVWDCPDCPALDVELDGSQSMDPDADDLSYEWSEPTASVHFFNRYSAITDATLPALPATYRTGTTVEYDISLTVADCAHEAVDSVAVTYTCTGQKP